MRLPRDLSGRDLARLLQRLGYDVDRRTGSHVRLTTTRGGEHHLTIPAHESLKIGTLNAILREVAAHLGMSREAIIDLLFR